MEEVPVRELNDQRGENVRSSSKVLQLLGRIVAATELLQQNFFEL